MDGYHAVDLIAASKSKRDVAYSLFVPSTRGIEAHAPGYGCTDPFKSKSNPGHIAEFTLVEGRTVGRN